MDATGSGERDEAHQVPGLDEVEFEELVRAVLDRMHGALDQQARLQLLLDAVVAISADLSLDGVLSRIVAIATSLADARYAALGVLSAGRQRRLRTFVHHGISDDVAATIGDLPTGHGLLGLIIDRPEPLRLHDIAEHPSSYGFPPEHPPMRSFLGVPVRIRDRVFGNLYLTEKVGGGDFTAEDEEVVVALAAAAGVAIENARLYEEARTREEWGTATAGVVALLSNPKRGNDSMQTIADLACQVAGADVVWTVAGHDEDHVEVTAISGAQLSGADLTALSVADPMARLVLEKSEPASVEDVAELDGGGEVLQLPGLPDVGPLLAVPLNPSARAKGALTLAWRRSNEDRYYTVDTQLAASFAEQAALALQLGEARDDQRRLAVLEDRDRIGRDLHDLVIQRLFVVGLGLEGAARLTDRPEVAARVEQAVDDLDATIKDIRRAIFGLGSAEQSNDIQGEVTRLVERAASTLKFRPSLRFEGPVRSLISSDVTPDLLAVLAEALSNASRHAEATAVEVVLAAADLISLSVRDDGRGMGPDVVESGLANIRARAEQRGGTLTIESAPGAGTALFWSIPRG
ncbi:MULTISPECIES: GAF domain-containing protein [Nocardioides]|uniref:GAF domain-containing protein n=1 Tax=Nocardioides vastitatis TaxID=2568655 RepID=A0ABW0ZKD8_9ACTN|nr:GAF domain-containing protein [Nocardioides sp.]THJ06207.1 GAF domain-containing protein [Nocardioides sp.]